MDRPADFALAANSRYSARVVRKLMTTDCLSDAGIGGLPGSRFIGIVSYTNGGFFATAVESRFFRGRRRARVGGEGMLRSHSMTSGQEKRMYRPMRRQGRGVPLCFPLARDFSYTQQRPTLSRSANSSGVKMSSALSVSVEFICNNLATRP